MSFRVKDFARPGRSRKSEVRGQRAEVRSRRSDLRPLTSDIGLVIALAFLFVAAPFHHAFAQLIPDHGSDRAGTSGFQFLKIAVDPRAAAMGETVAANAFDASALFWNPSLAAQAPGTQIGLSHAAYYADVAVSYAAAYHTFGSFTLGASLQALNSGDMDVTTEFQPYGTGETFRWIDLGLGLTIAQRLTDLFSYGVTARYVRESVAGLVTQTGVFDLGVFYRVGDTGAQMAVAMRNFGLDSSPVGELERVVIGGDGTVVEDDFEAITPPTTFLFGITYELLQNNSRNRLLVSGQLNNPNDNSENFNLGAEYTWNDLLVMRAGYRMGVEEYTWPSLGAGFIVPGLGDGMGLRLDYAFTNLDRLGTVHRVGANVEL